MERFQVIRDNEVDAVVGKDARPARRSVTARDVAREADVSLSTVSRAIRDSGYVAPAVKDRIMKAVSGLGYVPSATARNLKLKSNTVIGVIVSDLRNTFYADVAYGAGLAARQAGYTMMLADDQGSSAIELEVAKSMLASDVSGVVVAPLGPEVSSVLLRQGIEVVEIDRQFTPTECDGVVVNNRGGSRRLTERLIVAGHQRIGVIVDETDWTTGRERLAGYQDALHSAHMNFDPALVRSSGWAVAESERIAKIFLSEKPGPSAILAVNNVIAEGVWRAASSLGRDIPGELSLVAFDDARWMSMVNPGITVAAQDSTAIGTAAVELLLARMTEPDSLRQTTVLPVDIIDRGSVAGPPTARS